MPIIDCGFVDVVRSGAVRIVPAVERSPWVAYGWSTAARSRSTRSSAGTGYRTGLEPLVGHLGVLDDAGMPLV